MSSTESADLKLGADIDQVNEAAEKKIMDVLSLEHLSDEDKQKRIEEIDKFTEESLKDLASRQVTMVSSLAKHMEEENTEEGSVGTRMQDLENSLKKEQMQWLQGVVKEKRYAQQANQAPRSDG